MVIINKIHVKQTSIKKNIQRICFTFFLHQTFVSSEELTRLLQAGITF